MDYIFIRNSRAHINVHILLIKPNKTIFLKGQSMLIKGPFMSVTRPIRNGSLKALSEPNFLCFFFYPKELSLCHKL